MRGGMSFRSTEISPSWEKGNKMRPVKYIYIYIIICQEMGPCSGLVRITIKKWLLFFFSPSLSEWTSQGQRNMFQTNKLSMTGTGYSPRAWDTTDILRMIQPQLSRPSGVHIFHPCFLGYLPSGLVFWFWCWTYESKSEVKNNRKLFPPRGWNEQSRRSSWSPETLRTLLQGITEGIRLR